MLQSVAAQLSHASEAQPPEAAPAFSPGGVEAVLASVAAQLAAGDDAQQAPSASAESSARGAGPTEEAANGEDVLCAAAAVLPELSQHGLQPPAAAEDGASASPGLDMPTSTAGGPVSSSAAGQPPTVSLTPAAAAGGRAAGGAPSPLVIDAILSQLEARLSTISSEYQLRSRQSEVSAEAAAGSCEAGSEQPPPPQPLRLPSLPSGMCSAGEEPLAASASAAEAAAAGSALPNPAAQLAATAAAPAVQTLPTVPASPPTGPLMMALVAPAAVLHGHAAQGAQQGGAAEEMHAAAQQLEVQVRGLERAGRWVEAAAAAVQADRWAPCISQTPIGWCWCSTP